MIAEKLMDAACPTELIDTLKASSLPYEEDFDAIAMKQYMFEYRWPNAHR